MLLSDTHRLTRANLELSSRDERRRRTATVAMVLGTLLLVGGGALYLRGGPVPFGLAGNSVARENSALRAELEHVQTELGLERATRAELSREAVDLHARLNELTTRLEFLTVRNGRSAESK